MSISLKQLKKFRCRLLDRKTGQPVSAVVVHLSLPIDDEAKRSLPISTLRTDATGYVSFDLQPITEFGLDMVSAIYVSVPQVGLKNHDVLGQLKGPANGDEVRTSYFPTRTDGAGQVRRPICMEFPIYADRPSSAQESSEILCRVANLASVQRPDLCDYGLSPYSFVIPVKINTGGECCESLAPSTLPVQEHLFYRVVVRRTSEDDTDSIDTAIDHLVDITRGLPSSQQVIKFAEVLDYRQRWFSIGHSLGEIKYSLPLAPGESTQLAVIEWSRTDSANRFDSVTGKEDLTHWLKRDRTIEETIDAGLKESQGGWSWAGGLSSGMTYDAKLYGQYTGNWAAGGGTSNTWGDRDIDAKSLQELHDKIRQRTAYTRTLNSTVIVQATQAEANAVSTRRLANHNHCHAMTVQYYEVLRHYRLLTEYLGKRYAVLIPFYTFSVFSRRNAIRYRYALEQALMDRSLLRYFDALVRLDLNLYDSAPPAPNAPEANRFFAGKLSGLVVDAANFPMFPEKDGKRLLIEKDSTVHITARATVGKINFGGGSRNDFDVDGQPNSSSITERDPTSWPMPGAPAYAFLAKIGADFSLIGIDNVFKAKNEGQLSLWFNDVRPLNDNNGTATVDVEVIPPVQEQALESEKLSSSSQKKNADKLMEGFLLRHLDANAVYYNRAIWFLMDPAERRLHMEAVLERNSPILAGIDDKPIAVSGNYVAFLYDGPLPFEKGNTVKREPRESIVTLPTRGLFAEAQLGHCNSCEKRDVTRMWDWREMTAEEPPAISGVQPGPQGQIPTLTPAQLPANVIQIAQPPTAPDPTGLANALTVMRTADIFRDMSGLDEASELLGKLADGTISSLEGMVKAAGQAKEKVDAARKGGAGSRGSSGASESNAATPKGRTQPNEKNPTTQIDRLQAIDYAKSRNLIADEEARNAALGVLGGEVIPAAAVDKNIGMPMGIDVSHHQGNIDWKTVAKSGVYFAFIKASDGVNIDNKFHQNWTQARATGLTCGAYHFWLPQVSGKAQAETLIRQLGFLQRGGLPPVLDVEEGLHAHFAGLSTSDLEDNIQEFIDTIVAEFGVAPIIYTNPAFWKDPARMDGSTKFSPYLLWIANWDPKDEPTLPGGWPMWEFWQLTDAGRVKGVSGFVDMNMFNGDIEALWIMAGRQPKVTGA